MQASGALGRILTTSDVLAERIAGTESRPEKLLTESIEAEQGALALVTDVVIEVTTMAKDCRLDTVSTSGVESPGYRPFTLPAMPNDPFALLCGVAGGFLFPRLDVGPELP